MWRGGRKLKARFAACLDRKREVELLALYAQDEAKIGGEGRAFFLVSFSLRLDHTSMRPQSRLLGRRGDRTCVGIAGERRPGHHKGQGT